MPMDWEIKQRAQRGTTFLILIVMAAKNLNLYGEKGLKFLSKIQNSHFCEKFEIFFRFFHRSLAKSRRTAKTKI